MSIPPRILGALIGLAAAVALCIWRMPTAGGPVAGPILSECDGAIQSAVIQYVAGADFTIPVYRDFLRAAPAEIEIHVMCPDAAAYQEFLAAVGPVPQRLKPIYVGHEMTCWSRDRWLAFYPRGVRAPVTLLAPKGEAGAAAWPQRDGDQRLAFDLMSALRDRVLAERSFLYFDGGDFLADGEKVFVNANVIRLNVQRTVSDLDALRRELQMRFHREVVFLPDSPDHHVGMFMVAVGNRTVLVGDPSLAQGAPHPDLPGGADFTPQTQARFDSVAAAAAAAGYRVARIPVIPAMDGKTYITYVNGIIDDRAGQRTVYMPVFRGAESLNDRAEAAWRSLGYQVHRVDCTSTCTRFGNLHCLVNILGRSAS